MLKVIIVDDEKLAIQRLEAILNSTKIVEVIGTYQNGYDALHTIEKFQPDIIFLDIEMPEISGIEMAIKIMENNEDSRIVFVTAYEQYALKAFKIGVIDYILKPYDKERVLQLIQRFNKLRSQEPSNDQYMIHAFNYFHIKKNGVELKDVKWRTSKARELFIYLVQHSDAIVRKDILVELFWSDIGVDNAYDNLYTCIYQIRKTIEDMGINIKVINATHGYEIEFNDVKYDVIEWKKAIEELDYQLTQDNDLRKTLNAYKKVMHYYKGHYLEEESNVWKENMKEQFKVIFLSKSQTIIDLLQESEEYTEALLITLHIQKIYPYLDYSYFTLMQLYSKLGDRYNVEKQYNKLKQNLEDEFGTKPNKTIRNWYQEWIEMQHSV